MGSMCHEERDGLIRDNNSFVSFNFGSMGEVVDAVLTIFARITMIFLQYIGATKWFVFVGSKQNGLWICRTLLLALSFLVVHVGAY